MQCAEQLGSCVCLWPIWQNHCNRTLFYAKGLANYSVHEETKRTSINKAKNVVKQNSLRLCFILIERT